MHASEVSVRIDPHPRPLPQAGEGATPASESVTIEDVVYHQPASGPLLARLYRPKNPSGIGMVSVHGGRWCTESRMSNAVIDQRLADAGVFVMALDFRQPPVAKHPAAIADINVGIRWLKRHAVEFGLDPNAIGGIGTSSGGHQVLLNTLRPTDPRYASDAVEGVEDASLAFVVACWPVSDPVGRYRYAIEQGMQLHVDSHHAYWRDEADMADGNPMRLLAAGEATHLPPLLLVQGAADTVLSPGMSTRFADAWTRAGGECELIEFADQPHTFITKSPETPASRAALDAIVDFARRRGSPHRGTATT